ncbi:MAG TPA: universal stress protein [Gaiellaceae bacterium]|nr:universal stress protein [Gaiellaceae bacterium]
MLFERILVAIDGSDCSNRAFAAALELARMMGARLTALAVEGPLPVYAATIGEVEEVKREKDVFFRALAERAKQEAERAGLEIDVDVRAGHAAELISRVAAEGGYDLVVLGHRGHFVRDHLLGSTADRVAEQAPCPVMIVR